MDIKRSDLQLIQRVTGFAGWEVGFSAFDGPKITYRLFNIDMCSICVLLINTHANSCKVVCNNELLWEGDYEQQRNRNIDDG